MQTRILGRTGLEVTLLALGGAPISHQRTDRITAMRTVWTALEGGINLVDTSPHYGLGRSEVIIGDALRERPDLAQRCLLSTKTGHYGSTFAHDYDTTLRSVALSMKRLRGDHLDIVHIHDVRDPETFPAAMAGAHRALLALKEQGVIGAIGLGTKALEVHQLALASDGFDVLMIANQFDLLNSAAAPIIADAQRKQVGVIIAGAYATGILAKGSADPRGMYRYRPAPEEIKQRVAAFEDLCDKWHCALPAAAMQFCLRGAADKAIIALGARTPVQVQENLRNLRRPVPEGFWLALEGLLQEA